MKILALYMTPEQLNFIKTLQQTFKESYDISILSANDYSPQKALDFLGIFTWEEIDNDRPYLNLSKLNLFDSPHQSNFTLAHALLNFNHQLETHLLEIFPYHASLANSKGDILISNHKSIDPYDFEDNIDNTPIPNWVLDKINHDEQLAFHTTIPSLSLNQILIQTYQGKRDEEGKLQYVLQYVQDIKPLLKNYLDESGQALVGWSDVTSGASIHNDTMGFDD